MQFTKLKQIDYDKIGIIWEPVAWIWLFFNRITNFLFELGLILCKNTVKWLLHAILEIKYHKNSIIQLPFDRFWWFFCQNPQLLIWGGVYFMQKYCKMIPWGISHFGLLGQGCLKIKYPKNDVTLWPTLIIFLSKFLTFHLRWWLFYEKTL